ncbi:MAG: hypothetical protein HY711_02800 [Candidatus Melainabacteria bacterium]|nr:hypothetical protein [Candidatus Melainabacteria bacterium]
MSPPKSNASDAGQDSANGISYAAEGNTPLQSEYTDWLNAETTRVTHGARTASGDHGNEGDSMVLPIPTVPYDKDRQPNNIDQSLDAEQPSHNTPSRSLSGGGGSNTDDLPAQTVPYRKDSYPVEVEKDWNDSPKHWPQQDLPSGIFSNNGASDDRSSSDNNSSENPYSISKSLPPLPTIPSDVTDNPTEIESPSDNPTKPVNQIDSPLPSKLRQSDETTNSNPQHPDNSGKSFNPQTDKSVPQLLRPTTEHVKPNPQPISHEPELIKTNAHPTKQIPEIDRTDLKLSPQTIKSTPSIAPSPTETNKLNPDSKNLDPEASKPVPNLSKSSQEQKRSPESDKEWPMPLMLYKAAPADAPPQTTPVQQNETRREQLPHPLLRQTDENLELTNTLNNKLHVKMHVAGNEVRLSAPLELQWQAGLSRTRHGLPDIIIAGLMSNAPHNPINPNNRPSTSSATLSPNPHSDARTVSENPRHCDSAKTNIAGSHVEGNQTKNNTIKTTNNIGETSDTTGGRRPVASSESSPATAQIHGDKQIIDRLDITNKVSDEKSPDKKTVNDGTKLVPWIIDVVPLGGIAKGDDRKPKADEKQPPPVEDKKSPRRTRYVVTLGDTLKSIAQKQLGDARYASLILTINRANIEMQTIDGKQVPKLEVRQVIWLPSPAEQLLHRQQVFGKSKSY